MDQLKDTLAKFGTILVDRRFIAAVAALALLFLGVPESKSTALLESIGTIVTTALLLLGWSYRPPTGLQGWKQTPAAPSTETVEKAVKKTLEDTVGLKFPN